MKRSRYYILAGIPLLLLAIMWILSIAFNLISAPSDASVFYGFLLLGCTFSAIIFLILFIKNKYF